MDMQEKLFQEEQLNGKKNEPIDEVPIPPPLPPKRTIQMEDVKALIQLALRGPHSKAEELWLMSLMDKWGLANTSIRE